MQTIRHGFLLCCLLAAPALIAADDSLEQRVRVLEDRESIRTLLLDYGRHLDNRDWESFATLFARDGGTWDGGMGVARGREDILRMMVDTIGSGNSGANGQGLDNLHVLGNEVIAVDGDTATAVSKWIFVMTAPEGGPDVVLVGRYEDQLVREDGQWKFRLRKVGSDIARPLNLPGLDNDN